MKGLMKKGQAACFLLIFLAVTLLSVGMVVFVLADTTPDYIGVFNGISLSAGENLKEATNTYNVDGSHNDNAISDGAPQLTVLTHGYGSEASAWSNDFEFLNEERMLTEMGK